MLVANQADTMGASVPKLTTDTTIATITFQYLLKKCPIA
jgi:hypothetical protein